MIGRNAALSSLLQIAAQRFSRALAKASNRDHRKHPMAQNAIAFTCNICGTLSADPSAVKHRELLLCVECGSSARYRGIARAFQDNVLGDNELPLRTANSRKQKNGIGMSDWPYFVSNLQRLTNHIDTYYHQQPLLDVTNSDSCSNYSNLDYVICSEVLEHVISPVSSCLINIHSMLKPDGVLILTVPYLEGYESIEHFPHLQDFEIVNVSGKYTLVNLAPDGSFQHFDRLSFHGGPGSVLEMRVFGEGDILAMLSYAGFSHIDILEPNIPEIGYVWDFVSENPLWRGRRGKSCILVCRP